MTEDTLKKLAEKTGAIANAVSEVASLKDGKFTSRAAVQKKLAHTQQTMNEVMELLMEFDG